MAIQVNERIAVEENEVRLEFVHASGPGGQNVNKVATAVKLYFDIGRSAALPPAMKLRLRSLAGRRVSRAGVLVLDARRFRTQEANRRDAIERLLALLRQAAVAPRPRRPTRPGAAARARRLEAKRHRGAVKQSRRQEFPGD
jgi:ribosome-associated protein